ncbi:MAG: CHAT domain-containing protein [Magnetococcales bacterium]|nr:CHAT domain-containing protein [Magnetococcales bacterium]
MAGANDGIKGVERPDGTDGILTAMEAVNLNLASTDMVTLSACETGVGEVQNGEGVYSLQRAFQEAGAKAVLSTLWSISDEGTLQFMREFYGRILKGTPPQQALLETQKVFIKSSEWSHPFYWAPFVMVGVEKHHAADW